MRHKYNGLTLISLIMGIALSAFLIVAMIQIFATARANHKLSENLAELQNILNYTSNIIYNVVGQTGYRKSPASSPGSYPSYATAFVEIDSTQPGIIQKKLSTTDNRSFWIKFQGHTDGYIRDCEGVFIDGTETYAPKIKFYIANSSWGNNGTSAEALFCARDRMNQTSVAQPVEVVMIPAAYFKQMWLRFGEDTTGDGNIDRYVKNDQISTQEREKNVYALKIAILVHTRDDVRTENYAQTFNVFDETYSVNDKKIYKLQFFTIPLPFADFTFNT